MRKLCFAFSIAIVMYMNKALGSEAGMPQLNPEFWYAQVFWLLLIFSLLYLIIWKIFLPKITYSIENRKTKVVNDIDEAQKLKENAENKLKEYNEIIENAKKEAKKIIEDNRKKLDRDIESKKLKIIDEIEKEIKKINTKKKEPIKVVKKISKSIISKVKSLTSKKEK